MTMLQSAQRTSLRRVVQRAMEHYGIPGVAVGIHHQGEDFTAGYGVTNIEFPLPVDGDTLFQIGSTTKTFTATAVMQLVEAGAIDLDAPVVTYLPDLKLADATVTREARVHHLLTHTGGWLGDYFDDLGRGEDALRKIVRRLARRSPQRTPLGTIWSYNNAAFYIAGRLVEVVSGTPYERYIVERIFEPLGMTNTFWFPEDVMTRKHALGHSRTANGLQVARPFGLTRAANAAGGIVSSAADQLKWARFHLGERSKVLSVGGRRAMQRPRAKGGSMCDHVGLSWLIQQVGAVRVVKHGGTVNGTMSAFVLVPSRRFAVTVLTNGDRGHELENHVIEWALTNVLGVEAAPVAPVSVGARVRAEAVGAYRFGPGRYELSDDGDGQHMTLRVTYPDNVLADNPDLAAITPGPVRLAWISKERLVGLDEPWVGGRGEIVRDADGVVRWFRWRGRIADRIER